MIAINGVYKNLFTNKKSHFFNQKFSIMLHLGFFQILNKIISITN